MHYHYLFISMLTQILLEGMCLEMKDNLNLNKRSWWVESKEKEKKKRLKCCLMQVK
jgi:hypothetical protein